MIEKDFIPSAYKLKITEGRPVYILITIGRPVWRLFYMHYKKLLYFLSMTACEHNKQTFFSKIQLNNTKL